MLNSFYFDRSPLATSSSPVGKAIAEDTDTFARYCAKEYSLENYIAALCVCAFNKSPSLMRVQTFYVTFLKKNSPLEINVSAKEAASVVLLATKPPIYKPNFRGISIAETPLRTALNGMMGSIFVNLADTYTRYHGLSRHQSVHMGGLLRICTQEFRELNGQTSSSQDVLDGLNILAGGGWPVRHMSLTKIVKGF